MSCGVGSSVGWQILIMLQYIGLPHCLKCSFSDDYKRHYHEINCLKELPKKLKPISMNNDHDEFAYDFSSIGDRRKGVVLIVPGLSNRDDRIYVEEARDK